MSFPLSRSWQTSNLLTANALARSSSDGISLPEPQVDPVSAGRARERRPNLSLGASFQRSTARRACLPSRRESPPPTVPTTALLEDQIPSQICSPPAFSPSEAARSTARPWTSAPHTNELIPRVDDIDFPPSSPTPALDAPHLDAPDLKGRQTIHVRMPPTSAPLPPTPILQPRPPRTEELLPRNDDLDASYPQLIDGATEGPHNARADHGPAQLNAIHRAAREAAIQRERWIAASRLARLTLARLTLGKHAPRAALGIDAPSCHEFDAPAVLNHASVRAARVASSQAAKLTPPAGAHTRPPPAACWRFLDRGTRERMQSSSPGNVAKVRLWLLSPTPETQRPTPNAQSSRSVCLFCLTISWDRALVRPNVDGFVPNTLQFSI